MNGDSAKMVFVQAASARAPRTNSQITALTTHEVSTRNASSTFAANYHVQCTLHLHTHTHGWGALMRFCITF